ncbi:Uncharacterized protein Fot_42954 [Forsythia ovata]|uniref:PB1-like domain-containing protein n=1 Tax=Forsythia ovata TaxID=205694 RepID=A0ABD1RMM9_9LAMI
MSSISAPKSLMFPALKPPKIPCSNTTFQSQLSAPRTLGIAAMVNDIRPRRLLQTHYRTQIITFLRKEYVTTLILEHIKISENSKHFTIAWHYGSRLFMKPNNLKYEHGKVEYMDFVDVDDFSKLTVDRVARFMKYLGYKLPVGVLYKRDRMSLQNGLVRIKNIKDVKLMFSGMSPTVKWKTNIVIDEILEPKTISELDLEKIFQAESQPLSSDEPPIELESQDAYVPQRQYYEWAGVNCKELLYRVYGSRSGMKT